MSEKQNTGKGAESKRSLSSMLKSFDEVKFFQWENIVNNIPYFMFVVIIGIFISGIITVVLPWTEK